MAITLPPSHSWLRACNSAQERSPAWANLLQQPPVWKVWQSIHFIAYFAPFLKKIQRKKPKKKGKISPTALCVLQCGKLNRAEKNTRGHRLRKDPWTAAAQLMTTVSCTAWPLYICGSRWMNLEMEEKKKKSFLQTFFFFFSYLLERKKNQHS